MCKWADITPIAPIIACVVLIVAQLIDSLLCVYEPLYGALVAHNLLLIVP